MNTVDVNIDFKTAWSRLVIELEWCAATGHGVFRINSTREDSAKAVLKRMDQILARATVTPEEKKTQSAAWVVVDSLPSPLLYWCPVRGWVGLEHEAGVFLNYAVASDVAAAQAAHVKPLLAEGVV